MKSQGNSLIILKRRIPFKIRSETRAYHQRKTHYFDLKIFFLQAINLVNIDNIKIIRWKCVDGINDIKVSNSQKKKKGEFSEPVK